MKPEPVEEGYGSEPTRAPQCQGCVVRCRKHPVTGEWLCPRCDGTCEVPMDYGKPTTWDISSIADLTGDL